MRTYDLTPLLRSTIGFDRMTSLLESALKLDENTPSYPPYNIEKMGENAYRITMAVAGFGEEDIDIVAQENALTVTGRAQRDPEDDGRFLHRGIAGRAFERQFRLADHIRVTGASMVNGLLHIDLTHEIPEAMRPRTIKINAKPVIEGATEA